jgi:hypothetical protein
MDEVVLKHLCKQEHCSALNRLHLHASAFKPAHFACRWSISTAVRLDMSGCEVVQLSCRWTGRRLPANWTRRGSSWQTLALQPSVLQLMPWRSGRRRRPLLWRPKLRSWPAFDPSLRGESGSYIDSSTLYMENSALLCYITA